MDTNFGRDFGRVALARMQAVAQSCHQSVACHSNQSGQQQHNFAFVSMQLGMGSHYPQNMQDSVKQEHIVEQDH